VRRLLYLLTVPLRWLVAAPPPAVPRLVVERCYSDGATGPLLLRRTLPDLARQLEDTDGGRLELVTLPYGNPGDRLVVRLETTDQPVGAELYVGTVLE
jgi:hypothetical protein